MWARLLPHWGWRGWGLAGLLVGLGFLAAACGGGGGSAAPAPGEPTPVPAPTLRPDERIEDGVIITPDPEDSIRTFRTSGWQTDFTRHTVPYSEISSGGPPKDGIPAIDSPKFVTVPDAEGFLVPEEPVVLVEANGEARAYPLQILIWHEIVNDEVGGKPVVVTYCPLCNTALAFRRTFDGQVLDFGTTGNLGFSDLVMYDRQTETWWQQATAEGIVGTHAGRKLEFVPASVISFADFKAGFPQGMVLSRDTGFTRNYGANPYTRYDDIGSSPFLFNGPEDDRLPAMERVVTVDIGGQAAAYPFTVLEEEQVVNDEVGGRPIAVFFKQGTKSALDATSIADSRDIGAGVVFSRQLDGQLLTFRQEDGSFVDDRTASRWDITGRAASGPLAGKQLEPVVHGNHFWFSWAVFRPDTRVYQGS